MNRGRRLSQVLSVNASDVFEAQLLHRGDVIEYPAVLRREHNGTRTRSVVESVTAAGTVNVLDRDASGATRRMIITARQVRDNGVFVLRRAE